jgi:hypothetical protein
MDASQPDAEGSRHAGGCRPERHARLRHRTALLASLVPSAHEVTAIGVIDDFYDGDFANVSAVSNGGATGEDLLAAAESAFARRGVFSMLVVCPAAWSSKVSLLKQRGYRTAKLWMLRR